MSNRRKRSGDEIAAWVVGVFAILVLSTCSYDCVRTDKVTGRQDRIFSACMAESASGTPHWQAAQSCFKHAPRSRTGRKILYGYGLPTEAAP